MGANISEKSKLKLTTVGQTLFHNLGLLERHPCQALSNYD